MNSNSQHNLIPIRRFLKRLTFNALIGMTIIAASLFLGMLGYRHFENFSWVDAYENAAMILSGMGPVTELKTDSGKIFAGSYALFSGIIFLGVIALILAPVIHRLLHRFHVGETK